MSENQPETEPQGEVTKERRCMLLIATPPEEFEEFAKFWFLPAKTYGEWLGTVQALRNRLNRTSRSFVIDVRIFTLSLAALKKMLYDLEIPDPKSMDDRIMAVTKIRKAGLLEFEEQIQVSAIQTGFISQATGKPYRQ